MLLRLTLEDFFLIKGQEVEFCRGLNVITGETGTGKSLTVSSLLFLMGQEGDYPDGTLVEAEFLIQGEETVLRREVKKGRSRYYINGRGSSKKVVEELLSSCLLLQGQNDRTKIIRADFQREVYDRFAKALEIRKRVETTYQERSELLQRISDLRERAREREIRKRLLQEEIGELEQVGLSPQEYELLKERLAQINLAEKINRLLAEVVAGAEASREGISKTLRALRELSLHTDLKGYQEKLEAALDTLSELQREAQNMTVSYSPEELNQLNEKLYRVQKLERKYRMNYYQIWEHLQKLRKELSQLEREEDPQELQRILEEKQQELQELYRTLREKRLSAKEEFEKKVQGYLRSMGLERASFRVAFEEKESRYGSEQVSFLFSSYGKDEREIAQIASGGEISRLSLALFMLSPPAQTYVLDEVDTGISGLTSLKLARLLKELSASTQLLVITHSPAIASAADCHFTTKREQDTDTARIRLVELQGDERLVEIARLMGKVSDKTLEGAKELLREVCGV